MEAEIGYELTINLEKQSVMTPSGPCHISLRSIHFANIACINGLDDIGLTLEDTDTISTYEEKRRQTSPWLLIKMFNFIANNLIGIIYAKKILVLRRTMVLAGNYK